MAHLQGKAFFQAKLKGLCLFTNTTPMGRQKNSQVAMRLWDWIVT